MRNMSFALTTAQILDESKDVTRRLGWLHAKPGQWVRPVRKCMGLRPGEKLDVLRDPFLIVSVRREGFAGHHEFGEPSAWVRMFCATHKGCTPETVISRIEFSYREPA